MKTGRLKDIAHSKVTRAIKNGTLVPPGHCDNCSLERRLYAHHEDYGKPYSLDWLCARCHADRHTVLRKLAKLELAGIYEHSVDISKALVEGDSENACA